MVLSHDHASLRKKNPKNRCTLHRIETYHVIITICFVISGKIVIFFEDLKQKYFEDILLSSGRRFVTRGGEMSGQQRLCVCNETLSVCKIKKEKFFFSVCVDEKFLQVRLPLSLHRNRCRLLLWNRIL